jgi:hypothetical protein
MKQYIDKAAVVAELEKLYNLEYDNTSNLSCGKKIMLRNILLFLDTLEVKEVDLEEEVKYILNQYYYFPEKSIDIPTVIRITAKHFFEVGLKAQKG